MRIGIRPNKPTTGTTDMRVIRFILLMLVACLAVIFIHDLSSDPNPMSHENVFFACFIAFLLMLTLLLREHTESRLSPQRKLNRKVIAMFMLFMGAFGLFLGISYIIGYEPLPTECTGRRAKSICRIVILTAEALGNTSARVLAGVLWSFMGVMFCSYGLASWRHLRSKEYF